MKGGKYRRLVETLKIDILGGKYVSEQTFPSVRALARRFNLATTTVQRALEELTHQGLISRVQGACSVVTRVGASRKIGLILPGVAYSEFFPPIASELSRLANSHGYTLLFGDASSSDPKVRARQVVEFAEDFVNEGVSGVIFQPVELIRDAEKINKAVLDLLTASKVAVVLTCCDYVPFPKRSTYDVVGINNVAAGGLIAAHLLELGIRKMDFVLNPTRGSSSRDRCRGMFDAVRAYGKGVRCGTLLGQPDDLQALKKHMKDGGPEAFVCGSDGDAAVFKRTLEQAGLSIPDNVLLASFNDVALASLLTPTLTTVRIPREQIAKAAFQRLIARIQDPDLPPMECLLPIELVVRESTRRAKIVRRRKKGK